MEGTLDDMRVQVGEGGGLSTTALSARKYRKLSKNLSRIFTLRSILRIVMFKNNQIKDYRNITHFSQYSPRFARLNLRSFSSCGMLS